jgi:SNF2 family DNA or RNA helicase
LNFNEEEEQFSAAAEMISGLGLTDKEIKNGTALLPKYRALYAERVLEEKKAIQAKTDKSFRKLNSDFTNYRDASFNVPPTLENVLRDYQKEGFEWLKILDAYGFGGILADDMGLGKTIQIISVILYEKLNAEVYKPSIIVAPTSLVYNWEREFAKFAPDVITSAVAGDASSRKETLQTESPDVYITTYDSLKRDLELYENMDFKFIVADEAQKIKNASTKNAQAVKALQGETRFALTGTPIENSLSELWSIFDFVMSGYLFSPSKFTKMYETPIIKNNDAQKAAELKKQIAPFVLRRLKKDVLQELPDKIETTVYAEMTTEQRKVYSAYLMQAKGELKKFINSEKSISSDKLKVLQMLTRLRQICCHPSTFIEDYFGGSGKLTATVESLEDFLEGGHRILVFSQFTKMLDIIKEELNLKNIDYFYLDGSTSAKERLHMAERFNAGLCGVFLISLKAGGTGLNLTGADVVIHYDPWWNPAVMEQASDRAHRIGQKNIVQVVNIIAKQSVEEKIIELQGKKKNLADNVIEGETAFINKMTDEELLELFNE